MTPVIYRRFKKGGEVIAVFPTIPSSVYWGECESYMHIGQHGTCSPTYLINTLTIPAEFDAEDVVALRAELILLGYEDLKTYSRLQRKHYETRVAEIKRLKNLYK